MRGTRSREAAQERARKARRPRDGERGPRERRAGQGRREPRRESRRESRRDAKGAARGARLEDAAGEGGDREEGGGRRGSDRWVFLFAVRRVVRIVRTVVRVVRVVR
ncbi:hypothetical protein GCM10017688_06650 [Streptomyces ramulosus]